MNIRILTRLTSVALLVSGLLATPARADDSTIFSTTTGYVLAPARYAGKFFLMPMRIFNRGSEHQVVSTSRTVTYTNDATLGAGPGVVVTTTDGAQTMVPTTANANPTLFVTTGATINSLKIFLPNDLLTRRDDLIARIYTLKSQGKLTDAQVGVLLGEVQTVSAMPYPTGRERDTASARQVKMIYRNFDKVSNDIFLESRQGDRQLAGKYAYLSI